MTLHRLALDPELARDLTAIAKASERSLPGQIQLTRREWPISRLERIRVAQCHPVRLSASLPAVVAAWLIREATVQGRSVSKVVRRP